MIAMTTKSSTKVKEDNWEGQFRTQVLGYSLLSSNNQSSANATIEKNIEDDASASVHPFLLFPTKDPSDQVPAEIAEYLQTVQSSSTKNDPYSVWDESNRITNEQAKVLNQTGVCFFESGNQGISHPPSNL